ncbi:MAG TPA: hypothetical protein VHZ73_08635 [Vicinamibacterales bacterium]|jgi:hypothetical protein|nr:hypothetical protein [Vicinamibacterales bacterium]
MTNAFNILGRIISTLLGLAVMFAGVAWILQAYNLAFNTPMVPGGPVSFMVNNHQWAVYGTVAILVGLCQVVWTNTRRSTSAT